MNVPRVVPFVVVKRNLPLVARSYGHWWLEVDDDESYGWWPAEPLRLRSLLVGTAGVLNGGAPPAGGRSLRDPNHGQRADYEFHPVLVIDRTDDSLRDGIRAFATGFVGEWRWSTRVSMNCRVFQLALFDHVGLVDGTGNYGSRGGGCPALAPVRRARSRLSARRRWPRNLPAPGEPVGPMAGRRRGPVTVARVGPTAPLRQHGEP